MSASRRDFLKTTAATAAAVPMAASIPGVAQAMLPSADLSVSAILKNGDLLAAVGERLGFEAAKRVSPSGDSVSLMYLDYAGIGTQSLKAGIERGLSMQCGDRVSANRLSLPYGSLLGVAIVRNLVTAQETRVEIDTALLSRLAMLEADAPTVAAAKVSVMAADSSDLYRTVEFA